VGEWFAGDFSASGDDFFANGVDVGDGELDEVHADLLHGAADPGGLAAADLPELYLRHLDFVAVDAVVGDDGFGAGAVADEFVHRGDVGADADHLYLVEFFGGRALVEEDELDLVAVVVVGHAVAVVVGEGLVAAFGEGGLGESGGLHALEDAGAL